MKPAAVNATESMNAGVTARHGVVEAFEAPYLTYSLECRAPDGSVRWSEEFRNLVTTGGKNDLLDKYFAGSTYTAAWYLGLIDADSYTTGPAAGDTSASHGGWIESAEYTEGTRPALAFAAASGGSKATSAAAAFSINATTTLKGAFTITNSTKSGTTGILYSAGTFSADRSVINGDTLNVSVTLSA